MVNEIERAANALQHLDAGCLRDEWVRAGMAAKSAGLSFDDFHTWSQSGGNYANESECRTVWESLSDTGGVTAAILFGMARTQGWNDPARTTSSERKAARPDRPLAEPEKAPHKATAQAESNCALQVWARCIPATPGEAYIYRKQGKPDGLRIYPASALPLFIGKDDDRINAIGGLVVPCYAPDGVTLQTLQIIPLVGDKKIFRAESLEMDFLPWAR